MSFGNTHNGDSPGRSSGATHTCGESDTRYRMLFEHSTNGVAIHRAVDAGADFVVVDINPAGAAMAELRREEIVGRRIGEILPAGEEFGYLEGLRRAYHSGLPQHLPVKRYVDERIEKWTENHIFKLPSGEVVAVFEDQTEHQRTLERLEAGREQLRAIFDSLHQPVFMKDAALAYIAVNGAMAELFGKPPEDFVGRTDEELLGPETAAMFKETHQRALAGESIELEQTRTIRGTAMTFLDTIVPIRDSSGDVIGISGISRDITERRRMAESARASMIEDYPSPAMRFTLEKARIAAQTDSIVLLQGESGSGKDYAARWIHERSARAYGPYFAINCAALTPDLVESELFGHEKGSFSGAINLKRGMLELAEGGAILLNEIGELDRSLQSKLLTFLDTRRFMRVGGEKEVSVNARLMAATHRDLEDLVGQGRFLEALYYRLNVFPIRIPPLRERLEDLPVLVNEILAQLGLELQIPKPPGADDALIATLRQYRWPGNVRELRNVLERALMLRPNGPLTVDPPESDAQRDEEWSYTVRYPENSTLDDVTRAVIGSLCREALRRFEGSKTKAAEALGISRGKLYRFLKGSRGGVRETQKDWGAARK